MTDAIPSAKKSRGRPRVDATPVNVRVPPDLLADLDRWIAEHNPPHPNRAEAMRLLLSDYLIALGIRRL